MHVHLYALPYLTVSQYGQPVDNNIDLTTSLLVVSHLIMFIPSFPMPLRAIQ